MGGTSSVDRAVGALVGLACGDAVGTTLEFKRPGSFEPITDMVGGGPFGLEPGRWTDDTSMALCLAESIVDRGRLDPADQMRRYVLWWREGYLSSTGRCFDIGGTTRSQLSRFQRTGRAVDGKVDDEAAANGSLMRLAPVPIRWHSDMGRAQHRSGESSTPTHPAARPVDTCRVLGAMTAALIGGTSPEEVFDPGFWPFGRLHPAVEAVASGSWRGKDAGEVRGTGYCVDALEAAIWAVAGADDFRQAVLRAANLGDDADTTAAIAGQLAGARWGRSGIPEEWRARLHAGLRIESLARALHAAGGGEGVAPGWAHDDEIHGWWVDDRTMAGEYPGDPDPVVAAERVNVLVDHGIRTFVDLTGEADGLAPYEGHVKAAATARALDVRRVNLPIPDFGVVDDAGYDRIVAAVERARRRGGVYIHCWGGIGRTGTVVGCLLADELRSYDAVVARIAELRQGTRKADRHSPESDEQRDVIRRRCGAG